MARPRQELQNELKKLTDQVWFQPPENTIMKYPAIVYTLDASYDLYADGEKFNTWNRYELTIISRNPDEPLLQEVLKLQHTSFDTSFRMDNLNHYQVTLYY